VATPIVLSRATGLTLIGEAGQSRISGGSQVIHGATAVGHTAATSRQIFRFDTCATVTVRNLTFDGGLAEGHSYYGASYRDQQALIEFRSCKDLRFESCTFTRFIPAAPVQSAGGQLNPDPYEQGNLGPLFARECDGVELLQCKILTPSYGEGFCITQSSRVTVDRLYTNAGYDTSPVYGMSSALNITGPLCHDVRITNCTFHKHRGSCINLGGAGNFYVAGNESYYGEGIDCSIENTELLIPDAAPTEHITIVGNTIRDAIHEAGSNGITVGGAQDDARKFRHITVADNVIDGATVGIVVIGCEDVQLRHNQLRRVFQIAPAANYGNGIVVENCNGVAVSDNTVDGTERVDGKRLTVGLYVADCEDVEVAHNTLIDAQFTNLDVAVTDAYSLPYTGGTRTLKSMGHGSYVIRGQKSGATLVVIGRSVTQGAVADGTAAGVIRGVKKTGDFQAGEPLTVGPELAAVAGGNAVLIDRMHRVDIHDNQSITKTTTTRPIVIGPAGTNVMRPPHWANNQHNGAPVASPRR